MIEPATPAATRADPVPSVPTSRTWLLRGAQLPDGIRRDVALAGGRIEAIGATAATAIVGTPVDLHGYVLLPGLVEPHAHLDKAFTADRVANPTGDLDGAIAAWMAARPDFEVSDILSRARRAIRRLVASGTTAIRSHADTGPDIGTRAVETLIALREELADVVTLQVVACAGRPASGPAAADTLAVLDAALDAGADVIGGAPWLDEDPGEALDALLRRAVERDLPLDLHLDETLDPAARTIVALLDRIEGGFPVPVTASHVVSLGSQPPDVQRSIAERAARAGLGIVALPLSNLFLQGRGIATAPPRGLTAIGALLEAGATVAAGGDNLRDPFDPFGRGDPLATASLLATAGHLPARAALHAVTVAGAGVLGIEPAVLHPGAPADLVAVRATSLVDAIGGASEDRWVWRAGRLVARTRLDRTVVDR